MTISSEVSSRPGTKPVPILQIPVRAHSKPPLPPPKRRSPCQRPCDLDDAQNRPRRRIARSWPRRTGPRRRRHDPRVSSRGSGRRRLPRSAGGWGGWSGWSSEIRWFRIWKRTSSERRRLFQVGCLGEFSSVPKQTN